MRNPFKKKKDTVQALHSQAFDLRVKLTKLNDETTKTKQELSGVLSELEAFGGMVKSELKTSQDDFGVKPELWF